MAHIDLSDCFNAFLRPPMPYATPRSRDSGHLGQAETHVKVSQALGASAEDVGSLSAPPPLAQWMQDRSQGRVTFYTSDSELLQVTKNALAN